jgi:hypothetical protein
MADKENQNNPSNADADKDFGLPKVNIVPLHRPVKPEEEKDASKEQPSEKTVATPTPKPESTPVAAAPEVTASKQEETPKAEEKPAAAIPPKSPTKGKEEKEKSGAWIWAALILLLLMFGGVAYWYTQTDDAEPEQVVAERQEPTPPVAEEPEIVEEEVENYTLTEIKSREASPRYFLVVGSFIDDDMARDYSGRLNDEGKNTYLVYPYGKIAYYRLAIGEYENVSLALEELDRVQAEYQENLWVLKY